MKEILQRCSAFLLIGLLLIKISSFHVYEHQDTLDDSLEHCEHCLLVLNAQQSEGLITPVFFLQEYSTPVLYEQKIISSGFLFTKTAKPVILFSRPPPVQLI